MSIIFNSADIAETMNNGVSNVTGAGSIITENYTNVVQHGIKIDMSVREKTLSGTPPLSFNSNGTPLIDYTIYGNSIQDGTPTPDNPVDVNGVGNAINGNYVVPITTNSTTVINLNNVPTTRKIKKLILDGTEPWVMKGTGATIRYENSPISSSLNSICYCSHFKNAPLAQVPTLDNSFAISYTSAPNTINIRATNYSTIEDFKSFLVNQYANGTPVTIWYVLSEPEVTTVNEPLMKIGDYADSVSYSQSGVTIPTAVGNNTLGVQTTLKPSNILITYKGR